MKIHSKILLLSNGCQLAWYVGDGAKARANYGHEGPGLKWVLGKRRQAIFADMISTGDSRRELKSGIFLLA